jgi:uncharacterized membrane protein
MTYYEVLLLGHIIAATIWLGAGFVLTLLELGARRTGDQARIVALNQDVGWLAPRLFIPASLATLIFGILLVADGFWTFDELWIVLALIGWALSFLIGFFYFKPMGEKVEALAETEGPLSPKIAEIQRRVDAVDRVQLTLLFLVLADMILKPTGEDTFQLVAAALILVAAFAVGAADYRRGEPQEQRA